MHVYVINLARSPERRTHITAELAKTGLDYELVTAVDGQDVDLQDQTLISPGLLAKNDFPAGTAGCALSHLAVYEKIIADGRDHALVLEDDVMLPEDLGEIIEAVAPHLTGAEVALLNYGSPTSCQISSDGAVPVRSSAVLALPIDITHLVNAAAYVITREGCERMLERALPLEANADDWAFFYRRGVLDRIRCVLPPAVAKTAAFESTIGLYSVGGGVRSRILSPLVRRKVPLLHQAVLYRRQRILRAWCRSELVDVPFIEKPSRL